MIINKMKMYNVHANFSYSRNLILYIHIQKMYENYKARIFNEYYEQVFEQIDKLRLNATNHGKSKFISLAHLLNI